MNAYENRIFGYVSIPLGNPLFELKDFCRLRIPFPDSSCLSFFFDVARQIQFEWLWANPRGGTAFQAKFQGIPNVALKKKKKTGWAAKHLTVCQKLIFSPKNKIGIFFRKIGAFRKSDFILQKSETDENTWKIVNLDFGDKIGHF